MKLASFEVQTDTGPAQRVGVKTEDGLTDVTSGYAARLTADGNPTPEKVAEAVAPPDMLEFLRAGDQAFAAARTARSHVSETGATTGPSGQKLQYSIDEVRLLSPIPRPNSLRDCIVFEEHIQNSLGEVPDIWYEMPVYYKSNPDSIVHPGEDVTWPSYTDRLDYELELAVVIGKHGRNIKREEAADHIAGFTIFNDFSARDIQMEEMQVGLGPAKGKDFANALGPYLVTADDVTVSELSMKAYVNDELWSDGSAGEMYHSFADIIAHASNEETLYPGDVIGSGTVGNGCGLELDQWIDPGDTVALEIDEIGRLENRVVK